MENTDVNEHISPNCNNPTSETVNGQDDNEQQVDCKIQPSDDHSNTSPLSNSSRNQDNQESNQTELSTYDEAPEEPQLSCTMGPRLLEDTTNPNLLVLSGYQEELPLDADVDVGEDPISTNWEQHRRHVVASRRYVAEYNTTDGGVRVEEFDEVEEDHEDSIEEYSGEEEYDYAPAAHPKAQNPVSIAVLLVGNLATVVVLGLLYLNYVLFKSYFFVLLYSFLISEALWDTKMTLVRFIRKLNDVNQRSPRERLHRLWHIPVQDLLCHRGSEPPRWNWKKVVLAVGIISTVLFFMLVAPFVVLLGCAFLVCFVSVLLVFDTHVMKAFRVHRWFMTDDSLVALVVISVLLSVGVFFASSFVLLSIRDAMTAVEVVSVSVSKILDDDATQDLWKHATMTGTQALKSMVENFEGQYRDTAWGPIIDRISEALRHVEENTNPQQKSIWTVLQVNDVLGPIEWDGTLQGGWLALQAATQNIIPDWEGNQTIIDLAQAVFADPSQFINENILQVTGKLDGVITGAYVAILNSGAVLFSLVVSLFDFGVRMAFLLTLVFMLLSSKENVLHAFLKEFVDHDESNPAPNGRGQNTVLSPQIPQYVPSTINPQDLNIAAPTAATATGLHGSQESGNQQTLQSAKQSDPSRTLSGDSIDSLNGSQYGDTFTHSSADHIPPSENVMVDDDDDSDRYSQPKRLSPILQFEHKLRRTIEGVFMLPFKMALAHACCTFSLFYVFNADFMFFASSLSVFFTLFPVLYPQWISIPWCLIYMYRGYFGSSLTLQVLHYLALSYVDDYLLANFQMKRMKGHGMITVSKPVVHPPSRERRSSSSSISSTQSSGSSNGGGGQVNEVVERSTSDKSPKKYMRRLVSEPIVYSTSALNHQRHHRVLHRNSGGSTSPLQTQFSSKSKEEEISRKRNSKTNYLTGLSLFFGVNAFGAQGVLLGPLLVCLAIVVYETFIGHFKRQQMQQNLFHQMQQQQQLRANQVSSNPGSSPYAPMYASTAAGSPRPMEAATGAPLGSHSHNQLRFPVNSKRSVSEPILSGIQSSESKRQLDGGLESFAAAVDLDDSTDGEGVHATEASGGQQQWRQQPFVQPNIARNHIRQTIVKSPVALPDCSSQSSAPNSPRSGDHVDKASSSYDRDRSGSSPRNSKTLRNDVSRQYPSNRMTRRKSTPSIVSEKPNFKRIILNAFVEPFLNSGGNEKQEKRHHSPRARSNYYHKSRRIKRHSTESRALSTRGPRPSIFDDEGMDGLQESDYASRFQNQGLRQRRPHTTRASQSVQRKPFSAAD